MNINKCKHLRNTHKNAYIYIPCIFSVKKTSNLLKHGLKFKCNHYLTFCIQECIVEEKEIGNVKQMISKNQNFSRCYFGNHCLFMYSRWSRKIRLPFHLQYAKNIDNCPRKKYFIRNILQCTLKSFFSLFSTACLNFTSVFLANDLLWNIAFNKN